MAKVILSVVIVIGLIAAIMVFKKKSAGVPGPSLSPSASESVGSSPAVSSESESITKSQLQNFTITFAGKAASPTNITIKAGDTVTFVNDDDAPHWPASGIHPTHQICPGFDALRGLAKGETYSFTFNTVKTCPWHDHLNPSAIHGNIVINP